MSQTGLPIFGADKLIKTFATLLFAVQRMTPLVSFICVMVFLCAMFMDKIDQNRSKIDQNRTNELFKADSADLSSSVVVLLERQAGDQGSIRIDLGQVLCCKNQGPAFDAFDPSLDGQVDAHSDAWEVWHHQPRCNCD